MSLNWCDKKIICLNLCSNQFKINRGRYLDARAYTVHSFDNVFKQNFPCLSKCKNCSINLGVNLNFLYKIWPKFYRFGSHFLGKILINYLSALIFFSKFKEDRYFLIWTNFVINIFYLTYTRVHLQLTRNYIRFKN